MQLSTNQRAFGSPFGGSEQVVDQMNDRWLVSLSLPLGYQENAARNEAFLNALRGMTNTCLLWHMKRRQPVGSMRGAPTAQAAAAGAGVVGVNTTAGATLTMGDMIGVSGLLLQVAEDAVANGAGLLVVKIVNRLRYAIVAGSAVVWDAPTAPFRKVSQPGFQYFSGYAGGVSIDFVEAI
ncbi:hypothetical protein [Variovorax boronicumulans]|uniref:hypothetical protein n=1 Tax=Variovorax boronicumulans TaxID=436515 RepID=UPI00278223E1|nr:hypothetical protein [Variovorax boronicumulans]MDQ0040815.1 hypothetical protein [Variovorax boronicumulans]